MKYLRMKLSGETIMSKRNRKPLSDIEECKLKIKNILSEYNCYLMSADEWHSVLLVDKDTDETEGDLNPSR